MFRSAQKWLLVIFACWAMFGAMSAEILLADELNFNRDIRPILSDKCMSCHGPDDEHRQGDLQFDQQASVLADRGGYAVVVPGKGAESELLARITSTDADLKMPPDETGKPLTPEEITALKNWIDAGAAWSEHWAYETPVSHADPEVQQADWPLNYFDRFILARLESAGLTPSPEADPVTLIRRVHFDLTGLPPTPAEVAAFVANPTEAAYAAVVDELLSRDSYGERMAMFWLDLVRYADTVGYHGDQDHNISPYRDWVIDAFNNNMKFDQFTRAQLAGDLLEPKNVDHLIASGYNRLLQTTHEGGLQQKEYLAIYAADRVRNVSAVWMGATMGCAQCHTHKYDPYTITDFYTMAAFFADIDEVGHFTKGGNNLPTNRPPEVFVLTARERERFQSLRSQLARLQSELDDVFAGTAPYRDSLDGEISQVQRQLEEMKETRRKTMISAAVEPRVTRVLPRGNWQDDSGPMVSPAVPVFLQNGAAGADLAGDETSRQTRLDLANWLVDPDHGSGLLTARVLVNRLWALLMGTGLADLTDFGGQGRPPTHAELLDRMAVELVHSGWDVKQFLRTLALSRVYRQQSLVSSEQLAKDAENQLYGRQNRFRLPAEMIRDNALEVSGLLVSEYGGKSARPYQPEGYYRHLNFPTRTYVADSDPGQWRRGVYVHWQRQFLHPMLKAFDAPTREECTAERSPSNTPLAALTLLNDPSFVEAARVFATRILLEGTAASSPGEKTIPSPAKKPAQQAAEKSSDSKADQPPPLSESERLQMLFEAAVSRRPDTDELAVLEQTLVFHREQYAAAPEQAAQLIRVGLTVVPEKISAAELAAWTQVARLVLNLSETNTRN